MGRIASEGGIHSFFLSLLWDALLGILA
jgi:hypothetical protein